MAPDDLQPDRRRRADRFGQPLLGIAVQPRALCPCLGLDMDDERRAHTVAFEARFGSLLAYAVSFSIAVSSCSWIGPSGMTVEIACLKTSWACPSRRRSTGPLGSPGSRRHPRTPLIRKIVRAR